jgi:lysophospholipase L1-like esterase
LKKALRFVYSSVALTCVLLVSLELAGQLAFRLVKGFPLYEIDQHLIASAAEQPIEEHPFLVGRLRAGVRVQDGHNVLSATANHTRWTGAHEGTPGAIRIAVVGGSTTFGARVSDEETWPARLQALLGPRYVVTNFGMPGYSSAEAVIQMALLVPETKPDVVVFYEGWDELHNYHDAGLGPDYYGHGLRQYANLDLQPPQPRGLFAKLIEVSAVSRLAMILADELPSRSARRPPAAPRSPGPPSADPDTVVERLFRRNLTTLKVLARQSGAAYVMFIPQVLDPSRFQGDTSNGWTPRIRNYAMPSLLGRINRITGGMCADSEAWCTVFHDPEARSWAHDEFIDEGHFSGKGNDAFARLLAARLKSDVGRHLTQPSRKYWIAAGSATGADYSR